MVSGHWSWEAQMAGAASSVAQPYACHAGLAGWEHGWSGGAVSSVSPAETVGGGDGREDDGEISGFVCTLETLEVYDVSNLHDFKSLCR